MRTMILIAAVAATALSAPAFAANAPCIRQNDIKNWSSINHKTIILENYQHQKALLKVVGTCSGLNFSMALEIRSHGITGLSCVEAGDDIITRDAGFRGRCSVVSVTPYSGSMHPHDAADHDADHHDDHGHGTHGHDSY